MTAEFTAHVRVMAAVRSNGTCEICGQERAVQHHHRRPRGMGSTQRPASAAVTNDLHVCAGCHALAEKHRTVALMLGWLVRSNAEPADQPVLYRGVWAWLTDGGGIEYFEKVA